MNRYEWGWMGMVRGREDGMTGKMVNKQNKCKRDPIAKDDVIHFHYCMYNRNEREMARTSCRFELACQFNSFTVRSTLEFSKINYTVHASNGVVPVIGISFFFQPSRVISGTYCIVQVKCIGTHIAIFVFIPLFALLHISSIIFCIFLHSNSPSPFSLSLLLSVLVFSVDGQHRGGVGC